MKAGHEEVDPPFGASALRPDPIDVSAAYAVLGDMWACTLAS